MKKTIAFVLAFLLLFCLVGCSEPEYIYGDALQYPNTPEFVLSGTSDRFSFIEYSDYIEITNIDAEDMPISLSIPAEINGKPVKVIAGGIMSGDISLTTLTIPDSVEIIGNNAFSLCSKLEKVIMSKNLKKAGCGTFNDTPWIKSLDDEFVVWGKGVLVKYNGKGGDIKLPSNVGYISDAFAGNNRITSIKIPETVKGISDSAFYECGSLSEISLPKTLCDIGTEAFKETMWSSLVEGEYIIVGDGVLIEYRGDETEVKVPDSVKFIAGAFYDNKQITSITVPRSVKGVRAGSFYNCVALSSVVFEGEDTVLDSALFRDCISLRSVKLPDNLKTINSSLFYGCNKLQNVKIPKSVKNVGPMAFYYCINLTEVKFSEGLLELGNGAFFGCTALKTVVLPSTIERICPVAFSCCYELQQFELPPKITVIEAGAFSHCLLFKDFKVPERVTRIEQYSFESVKDIVLDVEGFATVIEKNVFGDEPQNPKIICPEGSAAEKFAKRYEVNYTIK